MKVTSNPHVAPIAAEAYQTPASRQAAPTQPQAAGPAASVEISDAARAAVGTQVVWGDSVPNGDIQ